jgi:hypothetical protein
VPRLAAFETIHDDEVVECLQLTTVHLPMEEAFEEGVCSFEEGGGPHRRRRRRGNIMLGPTDEQPPLYTGVFVARLGGREVRFRGLVRIRESDRAPAWIRKHLLPQPGTALSRWLREQLDGAVPPEWTRVGQRALSTLTRPLGRADLDLGDVTVVNGFRGLYSTGPAGCFEFERVAIGGRSLLSRTVTLGLEVRLARRLAGRDGRVPVVLRLRIASDGACCWYDGRSFGLCDDIGELPRPLRKLLDARGTAFDHGVVPMRPLTDLRPRFLLKPPSRRALEMAGGPSSSPPLCADRPALLYPSTDPLPLLDSAGGLVGLPTITDPAEAAAILVRSSDRKVYVPGAPPLDPRDLDLRPSGWLVGADLLGVGP